MRRRPLLLAGSLRRVPRVAWWAALALVAGPWAVGAFLWYFALVIRKTVGLEFVFPRLF